MFKYLSKVAGVAGYVIQYACITHCTFEYIGDFVVCNGPSMEPTLYSNNILLTDRITPRFGNIDRGDIIIAKSPSNPTQHICKRIVGLPGDRIIAATESTLDLDLYLVPKKDSKFNKKIIAEEKDLLVINNDNVNKKSIEKHSELKEIIVPRGHVWLEGDNTNNSSDSRFYGPVPKGLIKSRVICRIWPITQMQSLI